MKIMIADDHAIVRCGLRQILAEESDLRVVAEAMNASEALVHLRSGSIDLVVLDLNLPGKHGLELLKELKSEFPLTHVLVVSMHGEEQFGVRSLHLGADGYLTKESAPGELLSAIRRIAAGGKYISPRLAELLELELHGGRERPLCEILSTQEFTVFRLLASGKSVTEIGSDLALSVKTVSNYRSRALKKLGMKTNAEIVRYAMQHNLLD